MSKDLNITDENEYVKTLTANYDKLINSANKTVEHFEEENKRLKAQVKLLLEEKAQWDKSKETQNQIIFQTVTNNNLKIKEVNDEIQRLKDENKKLKEELKKYEQ